MCVCVAIANRKQRREDIRNEISNLFINYEDGEVVGYSTSDIKVGGWTDDINDEVYEECISHGVDENQQIKKFE